MPTSFPRQRAALQALSERTGTPVVSLVASFAVLHEVTAILPLVGFFYVGRWAGLGETTVDYLHRQNSEELTWLGRKWLDWTEEGRDWAERVGKRYGLIGFEKGDRGTAGATSLKGTRLAGDVANAVFAYGATKVMLVNRFVLFSLTIDILCKAIMPLRIGACLYFSPAFSRAVVDPLGRLIMRVLKR